MNREEFTLRELIQQRFEELNDHIAALDAVTIKSDIPSFLTTYQDLKLRYELEALSESLNELEKRIVHLEDYQTVQKFAVRQIAVIAFTTVIVTLAVVLAFVR